LNLLDGSSNLDKIKRMTGSVFQKLISQQDCYCKIF